ncbi:MAG: hypothetical protein KGN36_15410 [Acidobacteriota bacterium]|nr:hypothetical protein [Acidobacteriota bacterium]
MDTSTENNEAAHLTSIAIERSFPLSRSDGSIEHSTFASPFELVKYLSDEDQDDFIPMQNRIAESIDRHPATRAWKQARTLLKNLVHFPRYRGKDFDLYHAAARAVHTNKATAEQQAAPRD